MTAILDGSVEAQSGFGLPSEVGELRRVMIHRPDLELKRLTPTNHGDLLFDDVLWVRRELQEHDAVADLIHDRPAPQERRRGTRPRRLGGRSRPRWRPMYELSAPSRSGLTGRATTPQGRPR